MTIHSMTGYGQARIDSELGEFSAEIKSVNSRFCDINLRLPSDLQANEIPLREHIKSRLGRGKIDAFIRWKPAENLPTQVEINRPLLESYRSAIFDLQDSWEMAREMPWRELITLPGAVSLNPPEIDADAAVQKLLEAVNAALEPLIENRRREGEALRVALLDEIKTLREQLEHIDSVRGEVVERYRQRLVQKIEELRKRAPEALDDDRLEAEVVIFADKSDITEELVRLRAHLDAFVAQLDSENPETGKRLEFLTQEILREINTIGSKGRQTKVTTAVLEMKQAVEKIREQVANIQ